jgi:hypothetical protein
MSAADQAAPILDADALLHAATAQTGLADYGDDALPDRLRTAVAFIKSQGMDAAGERKAVDVCLWLLTTRLEFFADRNRYPIAEEQIERPIFATGEGRSGTTLLHALLSVDPNGRALRFWELMYPSPPPGLAGPDDPRRARADEDWREILRKIPKWLVSHPYNDMLGDGIPEDERTWAWDFRLFTPTAWWRVPMGLNMTAMPTDPAAQYRLHKMMLQHCQYGRPKKYWVLKGFHQQRLAHLFEAYPDAQVIWSHRDPVQVLASRIALSTELIEGLTGEDIDPRSQIPWQLAGLRATTQTAMTDPLVMDPRVHHVLYKDIVTDPVATIRGFYGKYGIPFGPEIETAMRDYMANNRGDRYGKFEYSTAVLGDQIEALQAEFAPYRERFGISVEQRS